MKRSINIDARSMAVFFYVHIELRGVLIREVERGGVGLTDGIL